MAEAVKHPYAEIVTEPTKFCGQAFVEATGKQVAPYACVTVPG